MNHNKWTAITNKSEWGELCSRARDFHDGFIKQLTWESPDFIDDKSLELHFEGPIETKIFIEMQNPELPRIELLFSDVQNCVISARADELAVCRFEGSTVILKLLQIKELEARSISYRVPLEA